MTPELERGRGAFERRAWREAFEALAAADRADPLGAEDLERLASSAVLIGREEEYLDALERAHHAHLEAERPLRAVRSAFWIGMHLAELGRMGPATGWFGRAHRLVEAEEGECVERGYLLLAAGFRKFVEGDAAAAAETADRATALVQRFDDEDLLALALHLKGRALVREARVEEGLALLDEAMVAVASDDLSPHVTGIIYCSVISACRDVYALSRAREWTTALANWCERQPDLVAFTDQCRVHRAEIMQLRGEWRDSIEEADRAREGDAQGARRQAAAAALYQQGEGHRLLGELAAAEKAYREASRLGRDPQPGLALLRLAQGEEEAAAASMRRTLADTADRLKRARLLPAHVEIMLAASEPEEAERAAGELAEIAEAVGTQYLRTAAAQARGAVALARGEAGEACRALREARAGWQSLEAPYEEARARELLGAACGGLGDEDTAALELEAARASYEDLGAASDLARLNAPANRTSGRSAHGLTPREREVLALVATGRTNRDIAAHLFISERTVARHVSNIFAKLGLSSRAAATAYAYQHDLLQPPA